ncbi:MAG: NAD(P)H-dependent oxidoreductase subunit E [Candidatus Moraniibacteriota bacterium]
MPEEHLPSETKHTGQATVKVCLHTKCCHKGAEQIFANLKEGLSKEEALILPVRECLGYCSEGPNIAINDNIVKGVKPFLAVETVRQELRDPSCKADGLGSKSLDDLDQVLEDATKL